MWHVPTAGPTKCASVSTNCVLWQVPTARQANYAQARQLEVTKGQGGDAGSVAKYSEFTLTVKVHGTRGMLPKLKSGMRKGVYVESR